MTRWEAETFRAMPRAVVLTIGCDPHLAARCHAAAALLGAVVREAENIGAAVTIAMQARPLAIVVTEAMHAQYASDFSTLVKEVEASLVTIPAQGVSQGDLEKLLLDAVRGATRAREPEEQG